MDLEARMAPLIEGLPDTVEEIAARADLHRPAAVEWWLARSRELLRARQWRAYFAADVARRLAAELPESVPREERFRLRSRSLELWGIQQRIMEQTAEAEGSLLLAFELLSQCDSAEPADLAVLLGRCALAAGDRGDEGELKRLAADSVAVAKAADREWPLPTFVHLWTTLLQEPKEHASGVRLARALFEAAEDAWNGWSDVPWRLKLEIRRIDGKCTIRLLRSGPSPSLPKWILEEVVTVKSVGKGPMAPAEPGDEVVA